MNRLGRMLCSLLLIGETSCSTTPKQQPLAMSRVSIHELTPGVSGAVLYVFAHQDDELLVLPKMILEVKAGITVHAAWITDGGKSANPAKRRRESTTVMKLIGVPEQNLHFLEFPDQGSVRCIRAAHEHIVALANSNQFAQVVSPAYEGGNIDHDVAAFIASQMASRIHSHPIHIEYPLYNRYHGRRRLGLFLPCGGTEEHYLAIDRGTRDLVSAAMKHYRSQRLPLWLMSLVGDKEAMLDHGVPYRVAPAYDFQKRPAEEPCDYERSLFHRAKFADWQKNVTEFLKSSAEAN